MPTPKEFSRRTWREEWPHQETKENTRKLPTAKLQERIISVLNRGFKALLAQENSHPLFEVTNRVAPMAAPLAIPIRNVDLTHGR